MCNDEYMVGLHNGVNHSCFDVLAIHPYNLVGELYKECNVRIKDLYFAI